MKIVVFSYDAGFLLLSPSSAIIAAAPDGAPPRRIGDYQKTLSRRASERP